MGVKLLLADKSITVRKAIQVSFRNSDTQVACVTGSRELASAVKSLVPDIILLSASLPELNLQKDIRTLSKLNGNQLIPVLLMADRDISIDSATGKKMGIAGILHTPIDERELKGTIQSLLAAPQAVEEMETITKQEPVPSSREPAQVAPAAPAADQVVQAAPVVTASDIGYPEQRAQVLMEILESYLNENVILITDALAKNLAPKMAQAVAGKILESIDFSDLPFKIATIIEGVIQDIVPQLAEELIARELDQIKQEAARLIEAEEQE